MKSHASVLEFSVPFVGDFRRGAVDIVEPDVLRLLDNRPSVALAHPVELFRDRRLAVRPHGLPGMLLGADKKRLAILPDDEASVVGVSLAVEPLAKTCVAQELDRSVLEHARANTLEHIGLGLPLEDDAVDPAEMQHVGQEQPRRTAADDCDLRALLHECLFPPEAEIAYCHPRARGGPVTPHRRTFNSPSPLDPRFRGGDTAKHHPFNPTDARPSACRFATAVSSNPAIASS